ncbi:hypothetical protein HU200_003828 [Digitaria exilis]|uniref:Uncharacterized protein n=1 Tax=Digitaria exilis TaxID=1010633 RepID=A0A835KVL1_9POAL|nr:hypothetical protein HU200_003828 [Digitaria exilis]
MKKKVVVCYSGTLGLYWARGAAACYPPTVGSGQGSLLCEASLTPFLPLQVQGGPNFRQSPHRPLPNLERAGQHWHTAGPSEEAAPNIHTTLMPPLGLQAHATELGEGKRLRRVFTLDGWIIQIERCCAAVFSVHM